MTHTPQEIIKKFRLTLAPEKGPDSIRVGAKLTAAQTAELKSRKPELLAALREKAAADAEVAERHAAARAERDAANQALIAEAKKGLPALLAQIPAGATRVTPDHMGDADGYPIWRYSVHGIELPWSAVTHVGSVAASHPGRAPFWSERVAYVPDSVLEAFRSEKAALAAAKAAAKAAAEAKRAAAFVQARETGQPVAIRSWSDSCNDPAEECSTDIVTEYALPSGTTRTDRVHTY